MSFPLFRNIRRARRWRREFKAALPELTQKILLLDGGLPPPLSQDEMLVTVLVKNREQQIEPFIEHHLSLGARHIVVLDNGSTDRTIERASKYDRVSVFSAPLPYANWQRRMKAWSAFNFASNGWSLTCDIDERFDYPSSDKMPLHSFLNYLNQNNYSVVQAHMLDLFSLKPVSQWPKDGTALEEESVWYDLTDIEWKPCRKKKREAFGGIRKSAFGASPKITKYPLLRWRSGARPSLKSSHAYITGRPADLTALLRHYKFDHLFVEQCIDAVEQGHYWNGSAEYKSYLRELKRSPDFCFVPKNPKRFVNIDQLLEEGFLHTSEHYQQHLSYQRKA